MRLIEAHNRDPTATFKMKAYRQFIGLTPDEVREKYFMDPSIAASNRKVPADFLRVEPVDAAQLNKVKTTYYVDLSLKYPTPVQNQGQCGNCYAYASTDTVNIFNLKAGKGYPLVSPQHLTECSIGAENHGCNGGWFYDSMRFQMSYGLYSLRDYPIDQTTVTSSAVPPCRTIPKPKYYIKNAYAFNTANCGDRMNVLLNGYAPAVAMAAGTHKFYNYASGILDDCNYNKIDHAVVLVGFYYDTNNIAVSYFKVKNSWGNTWGENGYVRIGLKGSACFVCAAGVFPAAQ